MISDYININGLDYLILDEINVNNTTYVYLSEENNPYNFFVRKVILENGKKYLIGLDNDEEISKALNYYFQKHKEEISFC